jgi:hypothetical protein
MNKIITKLVDAQMMNDIITKLVDAQMKDYFDGAYIDHGDARDQLMQFAAQVAAAQRDACVQICDRAESNWRKSWHSGTETMIADAIKYCSDRMRALG